VESSCEVGDEPLGSIKCWETASQLVAPWVVLSSIELVLYIYIYMHHGRSETTKDREATLHIYKIFLDTLQFLFSI
jgi:hypothetical protein